MTVSMINADFLKLISLKLNKARRVTIPLLSLALGVVVAFNTSSTIAAKKPQDPKTVATTDQNRQTGQLIATGTVTVNEKRAITGTTIFNDSKIAVDCARGSRAIVNLGELGRVELVEGATLVLRFTDGLISGELTEGRVVFNTPAGVRVSVQTQEGVIKTDGVAAEVTPVITQQQIRCVSVAPCVVAGGVCPPSNVFGGRALGAILGAVGAGAGAAAFAITGDNVTTNVVPPQ